MDDILSDADIINEFSSDWANTEDGAPETSKSTKNNDSPHPEHLEILSKVFGHKNFRPMQWEIISSVINDRRDNCAIMSTGYGKSLCYQFPSAYMGGVTIVISPLISLMEDQVLALKMANIPACLLGTAQTKQKEVIEDIFDNKYSLVYLTPEYCTGDHGKDLLVKLNTDLNITMIAVDEAHCVSNWGHDFRFAYRELGILKTLLPDVPILAVTATATTKVREDIIKVLKLQNPQVLCSGFDRPNLFFAVYPKRPSNLFEDLKKVMVKNKYKWNFSGPTIIYTISRKETEDVSIILNGEGIDCLPYHAGLPLKVRKETHEKFVRDQVQVIVATIAFGMGIDKPDVRNVIHFGASNCLESYYQEVGRAGRDGVPAKCVAFYLKSDFDKHRRLRELSYGSSENKQKKERMSEKMMEYLITTKCRREFILNYFQDAKATQNENCCDNCCKKDNKPDNEIYVGINSEGKYDFTGDARTFLSSVQAMGGRFGTTTYILFIKGSKSNRVYEKFQKHTLYGSGKHKSEEWWKAIGTLLETEKFLKKETKRSGKNVYSTVNLTQKGTSFIKNSNEILITYPTSELLPLMKKKEGASSQWIPLSGSSSSKNAIEVIKTSDLNKVEERELFQLLMNKRGQLAAELNCMPYMIASNAALAEITAAKPTTIEQLRDLRADGFTEQKLTKYGCHFLNIIKTHFNIKNDNIPNTQKRDIKDILIEYPLESKINMSSQVTCTLFTGGLTITEIAAKRGIVPQTVVIHLIEAMKMGEKIKLKDLEVTDEIRQTILEKLNMLGTGCSLSMIKNSCPEEITFNHIKAVCTYVKIRQHLQDLNIPYIEIEDFEYMTSNCHKTNQLTDQSQTSSSSQILCSVPNNKNLDELIDAGEALENDLYDIKMLQMCDKEMNDLNNSVFKETKEEDSEPPRKKAKNNENDNISSILDSPPREETNTSDKTNCRKLPPWLIAKKK